MRKELTNNGWNEITTNKVEITLLVTKPFNTTESWIEFVNRHPKLNKGGRNHCDCCKIKWTEISSEAQTYFAHSTKGNKILCEGCFTKFISNESIKRI